MAILINCPSCKTKYNLPEAMAGKKIRCKSCSFIFAMPDPEIEEAQIVEGKPPEKAVRSRRSSPEREEEDPPPRRKRRVSEDDEEDSGPRRSPRNRRQEPSGSKTGLVIGLVAGGGIFLALIVALVFLLLPRGNQPGPGGNPIAQGGNPQPNPGGNFNPLPVAGGPKLPDPVRTTPWEVQADPRGGVKPLPVASFGLKAKANDIHSIFYSPQASQFVVIHGEEQKGQPKRNLKVDLHDGTGQHLKTLELYQTVVHGPTFEQVSALGNDGTKLILRNPDKRGVLELWDLAEGKKISEWTPHGGAEVSEVFLLDSNRVLSNARGQVALWNLTEKKTIYTLSGYQGTLQVSPGKKYFVVCNGSTVDVMDASDGKRKGQLIVPGYGPSSQLHAAAFSADGKELAGVVSTNAGQMLARWNLATGEARGQTTSSTDQKPLRWLDQRYLLQTNPGFRNTYLIDWQLPGALVQYSLPNQGQPLAIPPDDRFWYFYENAGNTFVNAVNLPDGQAQALADQVAGGQVQLVIPPGSPIQVNIDTNNEKFRQDVELGVSKVIAQRGFTNGPGGFQVKLRAQGQRTGKSISFRIHRFGFGPGFGAGPPIQNVSVQEYQVDCDLQILDPQGGQVHSQKINHGTPFSVTFKSNDYQGEIEEMSWASANRWATQAVLPNNLYRVGGQMQTLPRMVNLQSN